MVINLQGYPIWSAYIAQPDPPHAISIDPTIYQAYTTMAVESAVTRLYAGKALHQNSESRQKQVLPQLRLHSVYVPQLYWDVFRH